MKKYLLIIMTLFAVALQSKAQVVVATQNFSTGLTSKGWTTVDNTAAGKWVYSHNPIQSTDYGDFYFNSPTAGNGFASMMSNGNGNTINTDLISPVLDCSALEHVGLQFHQWISVVSSVNLPVAEIWVTADGVNWTMVYNIFESATGANGELMEVDISSVAAGQSTVQVKFNYQAYSDLFWAIDDISIGSLQSTDASVRSIDVADYSPITNNFLVQCTFENSGVTPLTAITLNYSIDGGEPVSNSFIVNLPPFETQDYVFSTTARVATAGVHTITVFTSSPNNGIDDNVSNDSLSKEVGFMEQVPAKNVLVEEFTTAPCGYCPGGATYLKKSLETEGSYTIPVAHHAGYLTDIMTVNPQQGNLSRAFGSGAPEAAIDRAIVPDGYNINVGVPSLDYLLTHNTWKDAIKARKDVVPPVAILASNVYNSANRQLEVTVNALFETQVKGDLRINCYIVEDSIIGNTSYNQTSYYYASPTDVSLNPWYHVGAVAGNGVSSISGYLHDHVVRNFLGDTWGSSGVIPAIAETNGTYTKTYSYTLPAGWNDQHVSLVAFVSNFNSNFGSGENEVINAVKMPLNSSVSNATNDVTIGINEVNQIGATIAVSPNPATDRLYVKYSFDQEAKVGFEVYNMMGQLVTTISESKMAKGEYTTYINTEKFENGVYFLAMKNNNTLLQTLKFVVSK